MSEASLPAPVAPGGRKDWVSALDTPTQLPHNPLSHLSPRAPCGLHGTAHQECAEPQPLHQSCLHARCEHTSVRLHLDVYTCSVTVDGCAQCMHAYAFLRDCQACVPGQYPLDGAQWAGTTSECCASHLLCAFEAGIPLLGFFFFFGLVFLPVK